MAAPAIARELNSILGTWAVSGPALAVGAAALTDAAWIADTRRRFSRAIERLRGLLAGAGLMPVGGTNLFATIHHRKTPALYAHLSRTGILARRVPTEVIWLRLG